LSEVLTNPYRYAGSIYPSGLGSALDGTNTSITLNESDQKLGTGCYEFNNTSSRVNASGSIPCGDNFSVSVWANVNSGVDSGDQVFRIYGTGFVGGLYYTATGTRFVFEFSGAESGHMYTGAISQDTWYLLTLVKDDDNLVTLYLNAASVATDEMTSAGTPNALAIGTSLTVNLFSGLIDDTAIWNVSLPATGTNSVASLYNSGSGALANTVSAGNIMVYYNYDVGGSTLTNQAIP